MSAGKGKTSYVCSACGGRTPQWAGRCPACGAWNTLSETTMPTRDGPRSPRAWTEQSEVQALSDVTAAPVVRTASGLSELDRVLGGGLVTGSTVLLGGDPGIGKSTLLIQTLARLGETTNVLYVTGEESLQQVALRAMRLGLVSPHLKLMAENRTEAILEVLAREKPEAVVVDSIQTMYTESLSSAPGSVAQVREAAAQLVYYAKRTGVALFLVGHVTKEGTLAGPRVLEHMVDTVLYFEGEASSRYRIVRAIKNRFGPVNEVAIFAMVDQGLREVTNPSAIFIGAAGEAVAGSVVLVTQEGTRPLLVEVQALVDETHASNPRRVAVGLDGTRINLLLAVLHRHAGVSLHDQDVFVNVVGGVRISETAADLALLASVVSSFRGRPVPRQVALFGEVGLSGEVRPVPRGLERLKEAEKLGFTRVLMPQANLGRRFKAPENVEVVPVERLADALDALGL